MGLGEQYWSALRLALSKALREGSAHQDQLAQALIPQTEIEFALPCRIGDYTDFYTSIYHATAVGSLFRPDNPYYQTTNGCRLVIMVAHRLLACLDSSFIALKDKLKRQMQKFLHLAHVNALTTNWN